MIYSALWALLHEIRSCFTDTARGAGRKGNISFWGKSSTFYLICLLDHLSCLLFDPWPCHEKLLSSRLQTSIGKHAESVLREWLLINYVYFMPLRSLSISEGWRQNETYCFWFSLLHNTLSLHKQKDQCILLFLIKLAHGIFLVQKKSKAYANLLFRNRQQKGLIAHYLWTVTCARERWTV